MTQEDKDEIDRLREAINGCDNRIFESLRTRLTLCYKIGILKRKSNLPIVDNNRFEQMVNDKIMRFEGAFISKSFIKKLYDIIHKQSCNIQKK